MLSEFVLSAFAAFRITRLIALDSFPPVKALRDRILARFPNEELIERRADLARGAYEKQVDNFRKVYLTQTDGLVVGDAEDDGLREDALAAFRTDTAAARKRLLVAYSAKPTKIGELVTCFWCAGAWVSFGTVGLMEWGGYWGRLGITFWAVAGAAALLSVVAETVANLTKTTGHEIEEIEAEGEHGAP